MISEKARAIKRFLAGYRTRLNAEIASHREIWRWTKAGRPVPPPHRVKIRTVKNFARRFSASTMVETGTYTGNMVSAIKNDFQEVFSIELDDVLFSAAKDKFCGLDHVHILHGDSATVLPKVLDRIRGCCIFWLDAHYSGGNTARGHADTPIVDELRQILSCMHIEPVILIDDARLFVSHTPDSILDDSWPMLTDLSRIVLDKHPTWVFDVQDDIIHIHRPQA